MKMENEKRRLIDANVLIAYFKEQCNIAAKDTEKESTYVLAALKCCIDCFENFPTVDAVEVVHGRWNEIISENLIAEFDDDLDCFYKHYRCSICDYFMAHKTNYCPNCGAKMDLEE